MPTYIALLRGINVSGQKIIKMTDLKDLFQSLGFHEVQTYIQSGNVVFRADAAKTTDIESLIMEAITARYGFSVEVFVMTGADLNKIIEVNPYPDAEGNKLYITFFHDAPTEIPFEELDKVKAVSEVYLFTANVFFLYCPNGYGLTKLSNPFLEKKLKTSATTRNLNTVLKLCEMAK